MFPYTYLGYIKVSNYRLFIALGFLVALIYVLYRANKRGFKKENIFDSGIISVLCGIMGSKLFHIIFETGSSFWKNPWKLIALWDGGFVIYGGIICSVVACYAYIKAKKLSFAEISDVFAPAIALGIGIGRMACLSLGCCYGKAHDGFFSIVFSEFEGISSDTPKNVSLYPTQIFMILNGLFIFAVIIVLEHLDKKGKIHGTAKKLWDFSGTRATLAIIIYAVNRFFIEFMRNDYRGIYQFAMSPAQWTGIIIIVTLVPLLFYRYKKAGR